MDVPLSPSNVSQFEFYDDELDDILAWDPLDASLALDPLSEFSAFDYTDSYEISTSSSVEIYVAQSPLKEDPYPMQFETTLITPKTELDDETGIEFSLPMDQALVEGVPYPQVASLRAHQRAQGWSLHGLTRVQLGLETAERCHHITMNQTIKGGPLSHRVRVCKRCCGEDSHIELGTYLDQESAMLVNDAHEILQERHAKLLILTPQDMTFLHMFSARRYNRGKVEIKSVLDILKERELERDQRKTSAASSTGNLKRRRTQTTDIYSNTALVTIPPSPQQLVGLDKDSLILKLSPVLERMASHATLTFQKHDSPTFRDRFRYIFSKAITPSSMAEPCEPFETMLAGITSVLLSSFGDIADQEIRYVLDSVAKTYPHVENSELFLRVSDLMDEVNESPIAPELHVVNQAISAYLMEIKNLMWKLLQDSKFPFMSNDQGAPDSDALLLQTCEIVATCDRKRHVLSRIRTFLYELPARYDESHPALETTKMLQKGCAHSLCWYTIGTTAFRLRQIDLTDNMEHADVALEGLSQLLDSSDDLGSLERFQLLVHTLAVYNRIYAKRHARSSTPPNAPSATVQFIFQQLMALSKELGLLPYQQSTKNISSQNLTGLTQQLGLHDTSINELKCLLYGYIFEYSFIHSKHIQWPDGLTFNVLTEDFRATLRKVQDDAMQNGVLFVMPYAWRSLYTAMDACSQACFQSSKCLQCAYSLSQMCLNVLTAGGRRFGYAQFYAMRADDMLRQMHRVAAEIELS